MTKKHKTLRYFWKGIDLHGRQVRGEINAPNLLYAKFELQKQGINVEKIRKHYALLSNPFNQITSADIAIFSRQMATMIEAGIPLMHAFDIIMKGQIKQQMNVLIAAIKRDIEIGSTFAGALAKYPTLFNHLFCSLIEAGEKSGSLILMLNRVANYQEKLETVRKKIRKLLMYPSVVFIIALLITTGLLIFVIPQFSTMFKAFGAELPLLTRSVMNASIFLQNYWCLLFALLVGATVGLPQARKNSVTFTRYLDIFLLKLPWIGPVILKTIIARFTRTLGITLTAGLPLLQALQAAVNVTANRVYHLAGIRMQETIARGQSIQYALENTALFPAMVVQMIAIGEQSGTLEQMLNKIADYYEEEIDNTIESFNILLEPLIMSILGIVVGVLLLAMYIPIFKLGSIM
ncbi:type II secretion system F family protein [Legionella cardiaca]|uniref:Type II secretion system F family protein n=1 Tax=Legionella cardiaca TaxID=1071983 RepID=A0ABY8AXZ4_9GAMM|nr:type II secretion system F family protein [Legionella cardiaca]WED44346.1 type II secretion system F family protein [Legionella cardiaca]